MSHHCDLPDTRTVKRGRSATCPCGGRFTAVKQLDCLVWLRTNPSAPPSPAYLATIER